MFLKYYDLVEQPFGVTPDPRFLYLNRMYCEALASLWYGVKEGRGFMTLVAHPGMGKTTLLFQLLRKLRFDSARTVFLFQTCCNSLDLIRYLLQDLSIFPAPDVASMHQQLNDALAREAQAGKQFVFVIDEAQNLSPSVLETVRLLSDFETPQGKLLQIILAGQPQLIRTLVQPEMLQLRQRISVTTSLEPLGREEVELYVKHRLAVAGFRGALLFTDRALKVIARDSQGIPRNINNLCFGALSTGFALQRKTIDDKLVQEVAAEQNLETWQKRIEQQQAEAQESTRGFTNVRTPPSLWASRQVRRIASLAAMAGLLVVAGPFAHSYKPGLASHALAQSSPGGTSPGPTRNAASEKAGAEGSEPHPRAVFSDPDIVKVQAGDDLRRICLHHLGRYSTRVVQEIQALNPQLINPNYIEVGQEIRLPLSRQSVPSKHSTDGSQANMAALRK